MRNAKLNSWPCLACLLKAWPLLDLQTNIACCSVSIFLWFRGWWDGGLPWPCVKRNALPFLNSYFYYYFRSVRLVLSSPPAPVCDITWRISCWIRRIQWHCNEDVLLLSHSFSLSSLPLSWSWCLLVLCDMRWFCLWLARLVHANTPLVVTLPPWCPIVDILFRKWWKVRAVRF